VTAAGKTTKELRNSLTCGRRIDSACKQHYRSATKTGKGSTNLLIDLIKRRYFLKRITRLTLWMWDAVGIVQVEHRSCARAEVPPMVNG
jgi:hypothetical protein